MRPVVVLAFKYPPFGKVGALRWAKLAKYLAEQGHAVHVVTVNWSAGSMNLQGDTVHPRLTVHRIASGYWEILPGPQSRWVHSARYRTQRLINSIWFYEDEAQRWGPHVVPYVIKLLASLDQPVLVATVAPFQCARWAMEIRRQVQVPMVLDVRDEHHLTVRRSGLRERKILGWRRQSMQAADHVVAVTGTLQQWCRSYGARATSVIENGFDPTTIEPILREPADIRFTFGYAGGFFSNRVEVLAYFVQALLQLADRGRRCSLLLVGDVHAAARRVCEPLIRLGLCEIRGPMSQVEAWRHLRMCSMLVTMNSRQDGYALATKIYEYAALGRPVLSLNFGGEVAEFFSRHGFGHSLLALDPDLAARISQCLDAPARPLAFNEVARFGHDRRAREYSSLIQQLQVLPPVSGSPVTT